MPLNLAWPRSEAPQKIAPGQIHVWAWALTAPHLDLATHISLLDEAERNRLDRFHFDRDRARFAIAHANMRRILGAYLGQAPSRLRFNTNPFDKPDLAKASSGGGSGSRLLQFNLSHSQSVALLALSLDTEVGVDVEDIRPIEPEVAESHFSRSELAQLRALRGDEWLHGFYHCWTRKEAILKAEGAGLNMPLNAFDVSLTPGVPAALLETRPPIKFRHPWKLFELEPASGTAAALAAGNPRAAVSCFSLA